MYYAKDSNIKLSTTFKKRNKTLENSLVTEQPKSWLQGNDTKMKRYTTTKCPTFRMTGVKDSLPLLIFQLQLYQIVCLSHQIKEQTSAQCALPKVFSVLKAGFHLLALTRFHTDQIYQSCEYSYYVVQSGFQVQKILCVS